MEPIVIVFFTVLFVVVGLPIQLYLILKLLFLRDLQLDLRERDIDDDLNVVSVQPKQS